MKCDTCGTEAKPDCDWRQGRCPHRPAIIEQIVLDPYKARYYNLIQTIKSWFK
jgi:hypothetical protein